MTEPTKETANEQLPHVTLNGATKMVSDLSVAAGFDPADLLKGIKWPASSRAFISDLVAVLVKHSSTTAGKVKPADMLSCVSFTLGTVLVLQDPTKMTEQRASRLVDLNVHVGRVRAVKDIATAASLNGGAMPLTVTAPTISEVTAFVARVMG